MPGLIAWIVGVITLFALLLIDLFSCICGQCDSSNTVIGGTQKSESSSSKTLIGMNGLIDTLTSSMTAEAKAQYKKMFIETYLKWNLPVIETIDDIKKVMPYQGNAHIFKPSVHIGQRKLFLNEMQFFADHLKATDTCVCVYAGAAPSNHTGLLADLFPNVTFVLVDPNPFDVHNASPKFLQKKGEVGDADTMLAEVAAGGHNIYIINDLMTREIAHAARKHIPHDQLFFISDIRTGITGRREPDTTDIIWNTAQMYIWIKDMEPAWSMLKFRHPFYASPPEVFAKHSVEEPLLSDFAVAKDYGIDFIDNYSRRELVFFDGTVKLQAFAGVSSAETRLVTDGKTIRNWGTQYEYEDKLFSWNNTTRCYGHHVNPNANPAIGFDHCGDCALENALWTRYMAAYPSASARIGLKVTDFVTKLAIATDRGLIRENHGRFFNEKHPIDLLTKAAAEYNDRQTKVALMYPTSYASRNDGRSAGLSMMSGRGKVSGDSPSRGNSRNPGRGRGRQAKSVHL